MKIQNLVLVFIFAFSIVQCNELDRTSIDNAKLAREDGLLATVTDLKITTLSTMLANQGIGEWGYSALVEVDGNKILFDTGRKPETVLANAEELDIDLSQVEDVFLSHNHGDHTGGLLTLRRALKQQNPKAISRIHVGEGIFSQRINFRNRMLEMKEELEADGVSFIIYKQEHELFPGVWITGPIDRIHPEKNYGGKWKIATPEGSVVDNIPEDQSLVLNTEKGFVVLAGCGHAGIINTIEQINTRIQKNEIHAIIGGLHLVTATDEQLKWTSEQMQKFGVQNIIGSHCTGINSLYELRALLNLGRENAVVGSVGDHFNLVDGIKPGIIAG